MTTRAATLAAVNPTRIATRTRGAYTWDVVEVARYQVQILRYGHWTMVGEYHDTESAALDDAERMVRLFRHDADKVRVTTGGWMALRAA